VSTHADWSAIPTLKGDRVVLEPLDPGHADDLRLAVSEGDLWRTAWYTTVPAPDAVEADIETRLGRHANEGWVTWATRDLGSGRVVGVTSFLNVSPENLRVEIGSTWMARSMQGMGINTEAKLLQLTYAFETLDCNVVEFRTHWHNRQSRAAIAGLGAKQDGVLRNHMIGRDGTLRDTVVFSIIVGEWPTVRLGLTEKLAALRD
jgi:RimJ/RimL family protein N-acetyltransferase